MYPTLELGSVIVSFHTALLAAGVVVASLLMARDSSRIPGMPTVTPLLGLAAYVGGLVGARAAYLIAHESWHHWWRMILVADPGLAWWGGALGAALAGGLYLRRAAAGMNFLNAADLGAPYLCLVEAFARVGCFLNGCCWGERCDYPWGVRFPEGSWAFMQHKVEGLLAEGELWSLPVHPVQLYMALSLLVVFAGVRVIALRRPFPGAAGVGFGIAYGLTRFTLEFFRADAQPAALGLTPMQWVGLGLVAVAVWVWGKQGLGAREAGYRAG